MIKTAPITLTIGIPVHNEAVNIANLIHNLVRQKGSFLLERIIVVCDGSTDGTPKIVKQLATQYPFLDVYDYYQQKGKVSRLNEIYEANTSDLLLTLDGDILPKEDICIDTMVSIFKKKKDIQVVAAYMEPIPPVCKNFMANALYINYVMWNNIIAKLNDGNHIHNLHGPASMLRGDFAKSFVYPVDITCDEGFLYMKAKQKNGFAFAANAHMLIAPISTMKDIKIGIPRFLHERYDLVPYFGKDVLVEYSVPLLTKVGGIIKTFWQYPSETVGAIFYNFFIKILYSKPNQLHSGIWEQVISTKREMKVV